MKSIQIDRAFPISDSIRICIQKLLGAGFQAYIVGGSVRDFLLGRNPKDNDIATNALPDEIEKLFPHSILVGKKFGVIKVPMNEEIVEIATFRKDIRYQDHRHPSQVKFSGPEEDALRRDFTVNALFFNIQTSRILDYVGGLDDLSKKILRTVGVPSTRFREDALRLIRGIRISAQLGFELEKETSASIKTLSNQIRHISQERIQEEWDKMLLGPRPQIAFANLAEHDLLKHSSLELESLRGTVRIQDGFPREDLWTHTLRALEYLQREYPTRSKALSWALLLHEVGRKRLGETSEREAADAAKAVAKRFRLSRDDIEMIGYLIENSYRFHDAFQMREATLLRLLEDQHIEELLRFYKIETAATDGNLTSYEFCRSRLKELRESGIPSPKLITGEDLIALGMTPGPRFADILLQVEDLARERKLKTRDQALEYILKHFVV